MTEDAWDTLVASESAKNRGNLLLGLLFDVIRNGQAHQYHQIVADLGAGQASLGIELTGAKGGRSLSGEMEARPLDHLQLLRQAGSDVWLRVRPEILFLDFKGAIESAGILSAGLEFPFFTRELPFSSQDLRDGLVSWFDEHRSTLVRAKPSSQDVALSAAALCSIGSIAENPQTSTACQELGSRGAEAVS